MANEELIAKWRSAASLSDDELEALKKYFSNLNQAFTGYVPREYSLVAADIAKQLNRINDIIEARKEPR